VKFNPLIFSGFDFGGSSSGGAYIGFKPTVAVGADLPLVGNTAGDVRTTQDTGQVWVWDSVNTRWVDTGLTTTVSFGSTPNSVGYSLTLNNLGLNRIERHLELQPADATNPGLVSTTTQTFGGAKTFNSSLTVVGATTLATSLTGPLKAASGIVSASAINLASEVTGTLPIANGGTSLTSTPTNGQLLIGNGTNYTLATITGTSNQVSVSNGSGSITLSTPQDIATASSPTFAGLTLTAFSGVVKASAGVLSASAVSLTADVSGVLPVANGGTNSSTALSNNRFVISSGGALVEHSAVTASRALASNASGLPVAATTTSTELDYLSKAIFFFRAFANALGGYYICINAENFKDATNWYASIVSTFTDITDLYFGMNLGSWGIIGTAIIIGGIVAYMEYKALPLALKHAHDLFIVRK